jgi:hypothetical protein
MGARARRLVWAALLAGCTSEVIVEEPPAAPDDRRPQGPGGSDPGPGGRGGSHPGPGGPGGSGSDDTYLWTLSTYFEPTRPALFEAQVELVSGVAGLTVSVVAAQGLDKHDRKTKVGGPAGGGSFNLYPSGAGALEVRVVADANPLFAVPVVTVAGSMQGQERPGSFCGTFVGTALELGLEAVGSFTLVPAPGGIYPDPPEIDCAGNLAGPPPSK